MRKIASQPLSLCPDFPAIAERWEAWWRFESDRPLLCASVPEADFPGGGKCLDKIDDPAAWLAVRRKQIERTRWYDAEIPNTRIDIGPVAPAAFVGAPLHLAPSEQTSWQDPIIEDWSHPPELAFHPENIWFQRVMELTRVVAEDAAGDYMVTLPDLSGAIDAVANLRGPERLLMDLYDEPEAVKAAADRMVDVWEAAFSHLYDTILGAGAGTVQWLMPWSHTPYTLPTCDFNFSIGPGQFAEFCLPSLREQARRAGRCVFHLDGPSAAKHAEALAHTPEITAVQYTPGVGTPSALEKLDMFKMLQAAGKPLVVVPVVDELPKLVEALDPRGVMFLIHGVDAATADWAMNVVGAA